MFASAESRAARFPGLASKSHGHSGGDGKHDGRINVRQDHRSRCDSQEANSEKKTVARGGRMPKRRTDKSRTQGAHDLVEVAIGHRVEARSNRAPPIGRGWMVPRFFLREGGTTLQTRSSRNNPSAAHRLHGHRRKRRDSAVLQPPELASEGSLRGGATRSESGPRRKDQPVPRPVSRALPKVLTALAPCKSEGPLVVLVRASRVLVCLRQSRRMPRIRRKCPRGRSWPPRCCLGRRSAQQSASPMRGLTRATKPPFSACRSPCLR